MASQDGRWVVTYNGEIYNYPELRAQLEQHGCHFVTDSDTEVLLHGYQVWGTDLPERLLGMFAFALADRRSRELFLARDRFGEKPLFLLRNQNYLAFASELRPLTLLPDLTRRLNTKALGSYLTRNYVAGSMTMLEAVNRLEPAHWALISSEGEKLHRYWLPVSVQPPQDLEPALDEFRSLFDTAVHRSLRSDVPVGVLLSGGIDSSLVAEAACRQGRLSRAYLLDFGEASYSEKPYAEKVCARLGLELRSVRLTSAALGQFLPIVDHGDDPLGDSSMLAYRTLAELAASHDRVVLGGDGGDEIFGGYLTYQASRLHYRWICRLPQMVRTWLAQIADYLPTSESKLSISYKLWRFLRAAGLDTAQAHLTWNGSWTPQRAAALVRPELAKEVATALAGVSFQGSLRELQDLDVGNYLPNDILAKGDRMSMTWGLEARSPFLDYPLAQWGLGLPESLKIDRRGRLKVLLRAEARRLFGPLIANRGKQGFSIPIHSWLRTDEARPIRQFLEPDSIERLKVFDEAAVTQVVRRHLSGEASYGFELWGLAVLSAWHYLRVEKGPEIPQEWPLVQRVFDYKPE